MSNKNEGRKVDFYEKKWISGGDHNIPGYYEKYKAGLGTLLAFGVDTETLGEAAASYSTAIIELEDGSVKNIPVEDIVFKD